MELFLRTVEALTGGGASCVIEYVVRANRPADLERLMAADDCVAIKVQNERAEARMVERNRRDPLIANQALLAAASFDSVEAHTAAAIERMQQVERDMRVHFPFPLLHVDTTDGYVPALDAVIEFAKHRSIRAC